MIKKTILFLSAVLFFTSFAKAQETSSQENKQLEWFLNLGLSLGGTSPLPLPEQVRKISHYNPKVNPYLGVAMIYNLDIQRKWAIGTEIALETKGMRVKDEVKYMSTRVTVSGKDNPNEQIVTGDFVGKNTTNVNLQYLTLSIYGLYNIDTKWSLKAGGYLANTLKSTFNGNVSDGYLLDKDSGERFIIGEDDIASFDFSDDIRDFDIGLLVGGKFNLNQRIGIIGTVTWGLTDIFYSGSNPISFKLQNIYGTLGVSYRFR